LELPAVSWQGGTVAAALALAFATFGAPAARAEAPHTVVEASVGSQATPTESPALRVVLRAREEVNRRVHYDGRYVPLTFRDGVDVGRAVYPLGDLDPSRGVCTDVVVRAYRAAGIDLQARVHEDVLARREAYARVGTPDRNIDHRRVPNLLVYLERHAKRLPTDTKAKGALATFLPGDIVVWTFGSCPQCKPDHVGVVSDRASVRGVPLVIHNLGPVPTEDDMLDGWALLGHFRLLGR
jgi:uncharacterized protein YijF (DUF1287 family)